MGIYYWKWGKHKPVENVQIQIQYIMCKSRGMWMAATPCNLHYTLRKKLPHLSSKLFDEYIIIIQHLQQFSIFNKWWWLHIGWSLCTISMNYNQREHFPRLYVTKCYKHVFKIFRAETAVHFTGSSTCMFIFLVGKHMSFKSSSVIAWEGIVSVNPFCSVHRTAPAVFNYNTASTKVLASQPCHITILHACMAAVNLPHTLSLPKVCTSVSGMLKSSRKCHIILV